LASRAKMRGEQQAVALAPGKRAHRRAGALGAEEEVLQVAIDVARAGRRSTNSSLIAGRGCLRTDLSGIELLAQLVEVG
jgi:hypothetical protein